MFGAEENLGLAHCMECLESKGVPPRSSYVSLD